MNLRNLEGLTKKGRILFFNCKKSDSSKYFCRSKKSLLLLYFLKIFLLWFYPKLVIFLTGISTLRKCSRISFKMDVFRDEYRNFYLAFSSITSIKMNVKGNIYKYSYNFLVKINRQHVIQDVVCETVSCVACFLVFREKWFLRNFFGTKTFIHFENKTLECLPKWKFIIY